MPALDSLTIGLQHTCLTSGGGAELRVTLRSTAAADGSEYAYLSCTISNDKGFSDQQSLEGQFTNTFRFSPVPDGMYTITATDQAGREALKENYEVACGSLGTADSCDLSVTDLRVFQPTQAGAAGSLSVQVATSAPSYTVSVTRLSDNFTEQLAPVYTPGLFQLGAVKAGSYRFNFKDAKGCTASVDVTINAAPAPPVVVAPPPVSLWFAVGGLQPRPALLATPVSGLHDLNFAARVGLHVVVELRRPEQPAGDYFARLRKTVRREAEQVDISQALHTQLRPEARYPVGLVAHDQDATLAFRARYREVDQQGAGEWQEEDVVHYAVLSAVPAQLPTRTYLADAASPAKPLSAFASGQAVHWAGLPLDLTVWLPERAADEVWYAEFLYRNGFHQELEIRSVALPASLRPGVTRIPLPDKPPAQATTVTVTLRNPSRPNSGGEPLPTTQPKHDFKIPDFNDNDLR
ncbi:hypothetical protein [Hymenobacter fodinae]|uniref:Uncharacterized protein n=1 Tax=Hymenobacter fodinae TaxID=2510796 RepID=A0A4Z0P6F8_9BACT|nr:hypothetical protein [Hymenobacter fodinae]TGE07719.1 hypothetical protein EU556_08165 [Hymenobacter fodinae]